MKKTLIVGMAVIASAWMASASTLVWGQYGAVADKDGNDTTDGYAFIYLLADDSSAPAFNADSGTWNMNGATLVGKASYDANNGGWAEPVGTDVAAVNAGSSSGADQPYFAMFMATSDVAGIDSVVGAGNYFSYIGTFQGTQFVVDPTGPTYGTEVSNWDDVPRGTWSEARAVPEPTSVALLAFGLAALGLKRKIA